MSTRYCLVFTTINQGETATFSLAITQTKKIRKVYMTMFFIGMKLTFTRELIRPTLRNSSSQAPLRQRTIMLCCFGKPHEA